MILGILLIVSPLIYFSKIPQNILDIKFFYLSVFILLIPCLLTEPVRKMPGKGYVASLILLLILNCVFHGLKGIVFKSSLDIVLVCMLLFMVVGWTQDPKIIPRCILIAVIINIFIFLVQMAGFNPILTSTEEGYWGAMLGNSPRFATYLTIILPFIWVYSKIIFFLVAFLPLFLTDAQQTSTLIAVGIIFFFYLPNNYLRVAMIVLGVFLLYWLRLKFNISVCRKLGVRLQVWEVLIKGFFRCPLEGFGLGVYPFKNKRNPNQDLIFWSSYLQFIVGLGYLSIFWIGAILKKVFKTWRQTTAGLSILIFLVIGLIEYPWEIKRLWITLISISGLYIIEVDDGHGNPKS